MKKSGSRWYQWVVKATAFAGLLWGTQVTYSQEGIYRCGNSYTNNARVAKEQNCKPLEGGSITVVHSDGGARRPVTATTSAAASATQKASGDAQTSRIQSPEQQRRDNDAKAILQAELDKAQTQLKALKEEYQDGNAVRTALELRNPQIYINRLEQLKAGIERQEQDIVGITKEMSRLP